MPLKLKLGKWCTRACGVYRYAVLCITVSAATCAAGGSNYAFGTWQGDWARDWHLTQLQVNVAGGLIFTGGCFMTYPAMALAGWSARLAVIAGAAAGVIGYGILWRVQVDQQRDGFVALAMVAALLIGVSVIGCFIAAVQAVSPAFIPGAFATTNQCTALIQSAYGLGNILFPIIRHVCFPTQWRHFVGVLCAANAGLACLAFLLYPPGGTCLPRRDRREPLLSVGVNGSEEGEAPPTIPPRLQLSAWDWALLTTVVLSQMCWLGSSIVLLQNVGPLLRSLGPTDNTANLSMWATALFGLGHGGSKLLSMLFVCQRPAPVDTFWQAIPGLALLAVLHAVLVFAGDDLDAVQAMAVVGLAGFSYGVCWNAIFHTANSLFKAGTYQTWLITAAMAVGPGIGPVLLQAVIGHNVDSHTAAGSSVCVGHACYAQSYDVLLGVDVVGLVLAAGAVWFARTRESLPLNK